MSDEVKEVNTPPSIEQMVDQALAPSAAQETNSPENTQPTEAAQNEANSVKTGTPDGQVDGNKLPEHVPYSRFQEINRKEKEAREALEQERATAQRYAKMLDEVQRQKAQTPQSTQAAPQSKQARVQAIVEEVCSSNGWNFAALTEEQKATVLDQSILISGIFDKMVGPMLDERLGPMKQMRESWESEQVVGRAKAYWADEATKEGLDAKVVQLAIDKLFSDLDKTDPERREKLSQREVYLMATRDLIRERQVSQTSQASRDAVKANARPLGRAPQAQVADTPNKPAKPRDFVEKQLDAAGIR